MKERILEDLKNAMKNQDKETLSTIRMLKGAFAKKINGLGEELDLIPNNLLIYEMPKD